MRFVKDLSYFFSPKVKSGLKESLSYRLATSPGAGRGSGARDEKRGQGAGRVDTQGPICLQDESTSGETLLKQSFQLW